jgi:hypothetical protein
MKNVLGIDDAIAAPCRRHGHGMRRQHRVAEKNENQRRRQQHTKGAGDRNDGVTIGCGDALRRKARRDDARKAEHAGSDRAVHRSEQRTEHHARPQRGRRAARKGGIAGAIKRVRDRQPVEQQAHGHVERQRLQQIVFEQVDQPAGQRRQNGDINCAGSDAKDRAAGGDSDKDDGRRQAGANDADANQHKQPKPGPWHQSSPALRGRKISTTDWARIAAAVTRALP